MRIWQLLLMGDDAVAGGDFVLVASVASTGTTITIPTGIIQDEDIAVLVDRGFGFSGVPTAVTPSGFSQKANVAAPASQRVVVSTKILTTGDAGATVTGMASDNSRKRLLIFRRVDGATTITGSTVTSVYSDSTDPAAASASYAGLSGSSITLGILASGFTTSPTSPSFSPTETGVAAAGELRVYYLLTYTGDPGSVSVDQGNSSSRNQNILLNLEVT